jgi:pimeloyl-ACP methyl ester carboxylesterase
MSDSDGTVTRRGRRRVLQSLATGATIVLAGCSGDDDDASSDGEDGNGNDGDGSSGDSDQDTDGRSDSDATDADSGESGDADDDSSGETAPDPDVLEQRAREFVTLLDAGEMDAAYDLVSDSFETQLPPGDMAQFWDEQIAIFGSIEEFRSVEYRGERADGLATVLIRAKLTDRAVAFQYAFRDGEIAEFLATPASEWVQPDYVDPAAFSESTLTLDGPGGCELGATLSVPESDGEVPGVVLVHGSGDQGRDQTAGPNRTFRELAQGLASQGIAVLRYDQRTVACEVDRTAATIDDIVIDDAVTAVERLRSHTRVSGVSVAGHSLGGRLAPLVVDRADAAGLVMLAPLAEPVHEAIVRQRRYLLTLDGELSERDEDALASTEALAEQIRTLDIGENETINLGGGSRGRPFWKTLQAYDHTETAAELDVPILLIQGGRDYLVTVEDDLPIWKNALGNGPNVSIEVFEDLNHRFQPGDGPADPSEWTEPENPVDERVIDRIAEYLSAESG